MLMLHQRKVGPLLWRTKYSYEAPNRDVESSNVKFFKSVDSGNHVLFFLLLRLPSGDGKNSIFRF